MPLFHKVQCTNKKITKIFWRMGQIFIEFHLLFESGISCKKINQVLHWFWTEISLIQRSGVVIGLLSIMLYSWRWRKHLDKAQLVNCGFLLFRREYLEVIDHFGVSNKNSNEVLSYYCRVNQSIQKYLSLVEQFVDNKQLCGMLIIGNTSAEFCNILVHRFPWH